ncbi:Zn finger protein HypA/HybF (possibly regulating hydrogenase expression) [uncultured Clostridium sp.]|nr:Zn finger protein HypA/HybF (possibly regulating hydrogenase expression) [uncultured Clostridium sp.]
MIEIGIKHLIPYICTGIICLAVIGIEIYLYRNDRKAFRVFALYVAIIFGITSCLMYYNSQKFVFSSEELIVLIIFMAALIGFLCYAISTYYEGGMMVLIGFIIFGIFTLWTSNSYYNYYHEKIYCQNCNYEYQIDDDYSYCPQCGEKNEKYMDDKYQLLECPDCSKSLKDMKGIKTCPYCGFKFSHIPKDNIVECQYCYRSLDGMEHIDDKCPYCGNLIEKDDDKNVHIR